MYNWLSKICPQPSHAPSGFAAKSLCGCDDLESGWVEARRIIYDYELILIESGEFDIEIDAEHFLLDANSYLIVPAGQWHTTYCRSRGRRHYAHFAWEYQAVKAGAPVMTFFPAEVSRELIYPTPSILPKGLFRGAIEEPDRVFALMDRLKLMLSSQYTHEHLAARGVLLELLIRLLDEKTNNMSRTNRNEELAYRVRSALDSMVSTPGSDPSICSTLSRLGYSYEHLARVFRRQYGIPPVTYLHSIRIEQAKRLLKEGDLKIEAIANEVGYEDAVYFSRLFKRYTGMSPGRYRSGSPIQIPSR